MLAGGVTLLALPRSPRALPGLTQCSRAAGGYGRGVVVSVGWWVGVDVVVVGVVVFMVLVHSVVPVIVL